VRDNGANFSLGVKAVATNVLTLYAFAPDLMVLLINRLVSYDIEIVDNRVYIYSHTPFNLLDPATHERLASIVQAAGRPTRR
jgi:hypothetical protein